LNPKKNSSPLRTYMLLITYAVVLVMAFLSRKEIFAGIGSLFSILTPFAYALLIAYVLSIPMRFLETKIYPKLFGKAKCRRPGLERALSVALVLIFLLAVISGIFSILIPQLTDSVMTLISNIEGYIRSLDSLITNLVKRFDLNDELWRYIETIGTNAINQVVDTIEQSIPAIVDATKNLTTGLFSALFNFFMGLIICTYLLYQKESLIRQLKSVMRAFLPTKIYAWLLEIGSYTNETLNRFIGGQVTEAFILGCLCFIGTSILGIQYSLLVSVIIGITNLIPIFGPWIGAGISGFILLMVDPVKALWFIIFIVVLQQLENNLIYPKVVGSSIGLSGLWVIFAITIGGGLFGIMGIFLGIPLFAVIYKFTGDFIRARLRSIDSAAVQTPPEENQE